MYYWACFGYGGITAIIYSANDPWESDESWEETYAYDNEADALACIDTF